MENDRKRKAFLTPEEQFVQSMLESAQEPPKKTQPNKIDENPAEIENVLEQLKKKIIGR